PTNDQHSEPDPDCRAYANVRNIPIDEGAAADVVDKYQQRKATKPGRAGFPAKPMQRARNEIRRFTFFDNVEAAAVHHPDLRSLSSVGNGFLFFAEPRIEPGEIVSGADPHDAGEHVNPAEDQIEPFAKRGIDH